MCRQATIGTFINGLIICAYPRADTIEQLYILTFLKSVNFVIYEPSKGAYVNTMGKSTSAGAHMGWLHCMKGIGNVTSGLLGGYLSGEGVAIPFTLTGVIICADAALILYFPPPARSAAAASTSTAAAAPTGKELVVSAPLMGVTIAGANGSGGSGGSGGANGSPKGLNGSSSGSGGDSLLVPGANGSGTAGLAAALQLASPSNSDYTYSAPPRPKLAQA